MQRRLSPFKSLLEGGVLTQEPAYAGESIINFLSNEDTPWLATRYLH
jgi:hypothetical protein